MAGLAFALVLNVNLLKALIETRKARIQKDLTDCPTAAVSAFN